MEKDEQKMFLNQAGIFDSRAIEAILSKEYSAIAGTKVSFRGNKVFLVRKKSSCGIIDSTGMELVRPQFSVIIPPNSYMDRNTFCVQSFNGNNEAPRYKAIRLDGTQITDDDAYYNMGGFIYGYCIVTSFKGGSKRIIDVEGKDVLPPFDFINIYFRRSDNCLCAYTNPGSSLFPHTLFYLKPEAPTTAREAPGGEWMEMSEIFKEALSFKEDESPDPAENWDASYWEDEVLDAFDGDENAYQEWRDN